MKPKPIFPDILRVCAKAKPLFCAIGAPRLLRSVLCRPSCQNLGRLGWREIFFVSLPVFSNPCRLELSPFFKAMNYESVARYLYFGLSSVMTVFPNKVGNCLPIRGMRLTVGTIRFSRHNGKCQRYPAMFYSTYGFSFPKTESAGKAGRAARRSAETRTDTYKTTRSSEH